MRGRESKTSRCATHSPFSPLWKRGCERVHIDYQALLYYAQRGTKPWEFAVLGIES